jgi:Predicted flavoproteins
MCYPLAGVSLWVEVSASHKVYGKQMFKENLLITHKGLSGPAILQISSYWQSGSAIRINLLPEIELYDVLQDAKNNTPQKKLSTILKPYWPTKWLSYWLEAHGGDKTLQELTKAAMHDLSDKTHHWQVMPVGTEGMAKAEVSSGGIDCNELSSQTFMAKKQEGLYFIGEAI